MTDMLERPAPGGWMTPSDPDCPGVRVGHRTLSAYNKNGCRCPEAEAAHDVWTARRRVRAAAARASLTARMARGHDPRRKWRGPHSRVDPLVVDFLTAGYRFAGVPPTPRELQVAARRMLTAGVDAPQIGIRLGVSDRSVWRWQIEWRTLAETRTERRHADAVWRDWHKHGHRTA